MVLEINELRFAYTDEYILDGVSFVVNDDDRIGLVGYNGNGKTTLLELIAGNLLPNSGDISFKRGAVSGYLTQNVRLNDSNTVFEEMRTANGADRLLKRMKIIEEEMENDRSLMSEYEELCNRYEAADGYNLDYNIKKILNGMAFPEDTYDKKIGVLSGGERTRLSLARLLISNPDILLLDEPTNHLDQDTTEWLEKYLSEYKGSVIAVSHDRWFLDKVTNRTIEIIGGKAVIYKGNYSDYTRERQFNEEQGRKEYERKKELAAKLSDYVDKNLTRASTSNMAKSRRKQLEKLDLTAPENISHEAVRFHIEPISKPYKDVLTVKKLSVSVDGRYLVEGLDLAIERGDRLAIVGPNGSGKTTFLNVILGKRMPDYGSVRIGEGVKLSYIQQNILGSITGDPMSYIWDEFPSMTPLEVRSHLAQAGFTDEEVFSPAQGLSGGETARLQLSRVCLEHPNFLVLDEPTNHLDIFSKEALEKTLSDYEGTLIVVSHDRYFLSSLGAKILLIEPQSHRLFDSFDDYMKYRDNLGKEVTEVSQETKEQRQKYGKEQRKQRADSRKRLADCEKEIEQCDSEISELEKESALPETVSNHIRLTEICEKLEELRSLQSKLMDEWVKLSE